MIVHLGYFFRSVCGRFPVKTTVDNQAVTCAACVRFARLDSYPTDVEPRPKFWERSTRT